MRKKHSTLAQIGSTRKINVKGNTEITHSQMRKFIKYTKNEKDFNRKID